MEAIPLVVPQSVRPVAELREQLGRTPGLPASSQGGDGPLPIASAGRLFEELTACTGDESIGLSLGASRRLEDAPLGRDVSGSLTLGVALDTASRRAARYCAGQRLWVTHRNGDVLLQRRFPSALQRGRRQANDFALQMLLHLVRRAAGPSWRPSELHLEGAKPSHAEELAALSGSSTHFGASADCLVFPRSLLARPLGRAPEALGPTVAPLPDLDFANSTSRTIRWLLLAGELTLANVAEAAGTSTRSLQRRLADAGLVFSQLADEARFHAACALLRDSTIRIIDVSVELGYADAANFTRAFRRWAGVSPQQFRRAAALHLADIVA